MRISRRRATRLRISRATVGNVSTAFSLCLMPPMRAFLLTLILLVAAGCAERTPSVEASEPMPAGMAIRGEEVFAQQCAGCHPGGKRGLGPALGRPIPRGLVVFQVRRGSKLMPAFTEEQISERDVEALLVHLEKFKREHQEREMADGLVRSLGLIDPSEDLTRVMPW